MLSLPTMPEGARRTEGQILEEFRAALPRILGGLFDIVSVALKNERIVEPPSTVRMADAAVWLQAAEPATALAAGTLIRAIEESQLKSVIDRISENPTVVAIEKVLERGPFRGRISELHSRIQES